MKVDFKQAREFLERINDKDNIMIFTHRDLDGFAAGILLKDYATQAGAKVNVRIIDYGTSKMSDSDLSNYNKILLSDLAPSIVYEDLAKLSGKEILYTDHHPAEDKSPIPDYVFELRTTSQGYIPSTRTVYELTEKENKDKFWLAVIGTLSDGAERYSENDEFMQKSYAALGLTQPELMEKLFKLNFALVGAPVLEEIFEEVSKLQSLDDITKLAKYYGPVEKEFERIRSDYALKQETFGKFVYYNLETSYPGIKSHFVNFASGEEKEKIYVFATRKGKGNISLSSRNQSKEYNVSKILQEGVKGLKDSLAGGHPAAAGAQIHEEDLEEFKKRLQALDVNNFRM